MNLEDNHGGLSRYFLILLFWDFSSYFNFISSYCVLLGKKGGGGESTKSHTKKLEDVNIICIDLQEVPRIEMGKEDINF